ncbi:MAG: aminodeoxychorismate synthase component I [Bacteroidales bacterium]|nr:aminodeoxychorismate synthase component I [Bacteroidales bacterium]
MESNIIKYVSGQMNYYGNSGRPFFFMFDFEMKKPVIHPLDQLPADIMMSTPVFDNSAQKESGAEGSIILEVEPVDFNTYKEAFDNVLKNIKHGNSYLLNLTFPARIKTDASLRDIFYNSHARYRLLYGNRFVVFSPEIFVRIDRKGTISSFPMKGTIDASVKNAEKILLADEKERAEHSTITDLIRNDLSVYAHNVRVVRQRYIDTIRTPSGKLLQLSSEIAGSLGPDWKGKTGDIITSMLPAGSVSGAPKNKTLQIIRESEVEERGYYTGIFGIFTGSEIDSAVMIRYIEQNDRGYVYRSGGGITFMSDPEKEYDELIKKIYVPVG